MFINFYVILLILRRKNICSLYLVGVFNALNRNSNGPEACFKAEPEHRGQGTEVLRGKKHPRIRGDWASGTK